MRACRPPLACMHVQTCFLFGFFCVCMCVIEGPKSLLLAIQAIWKQLKTNGCRLNWWRGGKREVRGPGMDVDKSTLIAVSKANIDSCAQLSICQISDITQYSFPASHHLPLSPFFSDICKSHILEP